MIIREPRPWPAADIAETYRILTAPGMPFETEERIIHGLPGRVDVRSDEFPRNGSATTLKPQLLQALLNKLATN
jgi:hypothetical protein